MPISGPELDNQRVMELLKGPRGTEVTLGLSRRDAPFQVHLTRDRIPIQSVVAAFTRRLGGIHQGNPLCRKHRPRI